MTETAPGAIPKGFRLSTPAPEEVVIEHRRSGMGCMNVFLIVWLAGWTVGCVFLLYQYLHGGTSEDGRRIPFWFVAIFWAAEIGVAGLLFYLLFSRKSFHLTPTEMRIITRLPGFIRVKVIPKESIRRLAQVKDGGEGEDSFPSWGLKLEGDKPATLVFRQPYEASLWLGEMLSKWAGVEFARAPKP